jgi:hypothetical protein
VSCTFIDHIVEERLRRDFELAISSPTSGLGPLKTIFHCPATIRGRKAHLTCRPVSVASRWPLRALAESTQKTRPMFVDVRETAVKFESTGLTCRPVTIAYRCGTRGPPGTPQALAYGSSAPMDRAPVRSAAPRMKCVSTSCLLASACLTLPILRASLLCDPCTRSHTSLQQQERPTTTSALIEVSPRSWLVSLLLIVFSLSTGCAANFF